MRPAGPAPMTATWGDEEGIEVSGITGSLVLCMESVDGSRDGDVPRRRSPLLCQRAIPTHTLARLRLTHPHPDEFRWLQALIVHVELAVRGFREPQPSLLALEHRFSEALARERWRTGCGTGDAAARGSGCRPEKPPQATPSLPTNRPIPALRGNTRSKQVARGFITDGIRFFA